MSDSHDENAQEKRRDSVLKRMLEKPPDPHKTKRSKEKDTKK